MTHIIQTVFTGRGTPEGDQESDEWIKKRIELFKKYSLESLLKQTNRNFLHWISWRNKNELSDELEKYLKSINYNFVFTYNGQPYWDDRASNDTLEERLSKDLEVIKNYCKDDWVYLTVFDSDDIFRKDVIDIIQSKEPKERKAIIFENGYVLNHDTGERAEWNPLTNPPFYTIIYPKDIFLNAKEKLKYDKPFTTHEDVPKIFNCVKITERAYSYVIHGKNKSTRWDHSFKGKIVDEKINY